MNIVSDRFYRSQRKAMFPIFEFDFDLECYIWNEWAITPHFKIDWESDEFDEDWDDMDWDQFDAQINEVESYTVTDGNSEAEYDSFADAVNHVASRVCPMV